MAQDMNEATQVMGASGAPPEDRTMVAGSPPPFQGEGPGVGAAATQMGATVACPICHTNNSSLETYCGECGFLLSSTPGQVEPEPMEETGGPELVENASGRRFRLRPGINTLGRENCDILLMDGTVSRRHAQITVENGTVTVTDTGSTNGTQVDGVRIPANQPTPVSPGALLRFGNAALTLAPLTPGPSPSEGRGEEAAAPAEPTIAVQVETPAPPPPMPEEAALQPPITGEIAPRPPITGETEAGAAPQLISTPPPMTEGEEPPLYRFVPLSESAQEVLVRPGAMTIGRRTGNTVVLAGDPYVSGRHAEVTCDATGCYLSDLGSTNGTLVNGERLEPGQKQLLLDGDEIQIGQGAYRFETLELPEEGVVSRESQVESEDAHDSRLTTHDSEEGEGA
jgi:pSer/pThr/pTyr-binding forkhead associated (FHA) protein